MVLKDGFRRSIRSALVAMVGRLLVYALMLGVLSVWMLWGAVRYDELFYEEVGPVEILETVFALFSALIFLWTARLDSVRTFCSVLLAGLFFCMTVRESDYFLDVLVGRHTWKGIVALILIGLFFYTASRMKEAYRSVLVFINRPCFGVFTSGVLVLVIFSRLFGYGPFWLAIMDDQSYRIVKTIVEEGVELMGYFLILISSFEYFHDARIGRKHPDVPGNCISETDNLS